MKILSIFYYYFSKQKNPFLEETIESKSQKENATEEIDSNGQKSECGRQR